MLFGTSRFFSKLISVAAVSTALAFGVSAQVASLSYWLLLRDNGRTWCGYTNQDEFKSDVKELGPTDTVRVTFSADTLTEVTYQIEPESGDWVVVDKYTPIKDDLALRRANLLTQPNLEVIQETFIHGGKASHPSG